MNDERNLFSFKYVMSEEVPKTINSLKSKKKESLSYLIPVQKQSFGDVLEKTCS